MSTILSKIKLLQIPKNGIVIFFVIITPFLVDQLNGFIKFHLHSNLSVSQYYKAVIILLMVTYVVFKFNQYSIKLIIVLSVMTLITIGCIKYSNQAHFQIDYFKIIRYNLRLLFMPISYTFFVTFFKSHSFSVKQFYRSLEIVFYVFFIAVFLSLFGFGIPTYAFYLRTTGETIGYSGYFISTNEIGAVLIAIFSFILYRHLVHKQTLIYIIAALIISVLIGTKTMYASFIVIVILLIYNKFKFNNFKISSFKIKRIWAIILSFLPLIAFIITIVFYDFIKPSINRIITKINEHDNLLNFLTSSRLTRIEPTYNVLLDKANWANYLFGYGHDSYYIINRSIYKYFGAIEIDFFDILGVTGILGTGFIYLIWTHLFFKIRKSFYLKKNDISIPMFVCVVLLAIISFVTGHVLTSSLGGILFGYIFAFNTKIRNESINS